MEEEGLLEDIGNDGQAFNLPSPSILPPSPQYRNFTLWRPYEISIA
jgi:hypothetical protein